MKKRTFFAISIIVILSFALSGCAGLFGPKTAVDDIYINETSILIQVGESENLIATVTPDDATDKSVKWSTSNSSVAKVQDGKVTGVSYGIATVTATASSGDSATCTVYVGDAQYTQSGNYVYMGEFPQTVKADYVTVSETVDENGYYLGDDGELYAKVISSPYENTYEFSNGNALRTGQTYYFKVEPIKWRILSSTDDEFFLLCDSIIVNKSFGNTNNYESSEVREWLNDEFLEFAFNEWEQASILTTDVENGAQSTGYNSNPYACGDTKDKVFLLSYKEITNQSYGFNSDYLESDNQRKMKTTDYARAKGAYVQVNLATYGNGYWWLRSAGDGANNYAWLAFSRGDMKASGNVTDDSAGVVPAIRVKK